MIKIGYWRESCIVLCGRCRCEENSECATQLYYLPEMNYSTLPGIIINCKICLLIISYFVCVQLTTEVANKTYMHKHNLLITFVQIKIRSILNAKLTVL